MLGGTPEQFWNSTHREVYMHTEAMLRRIDFDRREAKWRMWHSAVLQRTNKFPKNLKQFLDDDPAKPTLKTAKQINDMWKDFFLANGGKLEDWEEAERRSANDNAAA